jgi:hypothetical protein
VTTGKKSGPPNSIIKIKNKNKKIAAGGSKS